MLDKYVHGATEHTTAICADAKPYAIIYRPHYTNTFKARQYNAHYKNAEGHS